MKSSRLFLFVMSALILLNTSLSAQGFDSFFSLPSDTPAPASPATTETPAAPAPLALSSEALTAVATVSATSTVEAAVPVTGESRAATGEAAAKSADGYKGIPWGTSLDKFRLLKNYTGAFDVPDNKTLSTPAAVDLAVIFDAKLRTDVVPICADPGRIPNSFISVTFDDVNYVFYNGAFSLATSFVNEKNYAQYLTRLSDKYPSIMTMSKTVEGKKHLSHVFTTTLFDKDNAKIFLVKHETKEKGKVKSASVRVIYIGDKHFNSIKKDLSNIQEQKKRTIENDMLKLE